MTISSPTSKMCTAKLQTNKQKLVPFFIYLVLVLFLFIFKKRTKLWNFTSKRSPIIYVASVWPFEQDELQQTAGECCSLSRQLGDFTALAFRFMVEVGSGMLLQHSWICPTAAGVFCHDRSNINQTNMDFAYLQNKNSKYNLPRNKLVMYRKI